MAFFVENVPKILNYKIFYEISTSVIRGVTLGRTYGERDRH